MFILYIFLKYGSFKSFHIKVFGSDSKAFVLASLVISVDAPLWDTLQALFHLRGATWFRKLSKPDRVRNGGLLFFCFPHPLKGNTSLDLHEVYPTPRAIFIN